MIHTSDILFFATMAATGPLLHATFSWLTKDSANSIVQKARKASTKAMLFGLALAAVIISIALASPKSHVWMYMFFALAGIALLQLLGIMASFMDGSVRSKVEKPFKHPATIAVSVFLYRALKTSAKVLKFLMKASGKAQKSTDLSNPNSGGRFGYHGYLTYEERARRHGYMD